MPELFTVDAALLTSARQTMDRFPELVWLLGGSCTGKSTVSRWLAKRVGIEVLDMDTLIYGSFMPCYTAERHPAAKRWFGAANPLEWILSLTGEEFDSLNRASNAEFLDLLAAQLSERAAKGPLLVDGGLTHPSVLVQVIPASRIVSLATSDENRFREWETAANRADMKRWIHELPEGQAKWQKFLSFDKLIADTIVAESDQAGIPVVTRHDDMSVAHLTERVCSALDLNCVTDAV